jgi:hypothetical protein
MHSFEATILAHHLEVHRHRPRVDVDLSRVWPPLTVLQLYVQPMLLGHPDLGVWPWPALVLGSGDRERVLSGEVARDGFSRRHRQHLVLRVRLGELRQGGGDELLAKHLAEAGAGDRVEEHARRRAGVDEAGLDRTRDEVEGRNLCHDLARSRYLALEDLSGGNYYDAIIVTYGFEILQPLVDSELF